MSRRSVAVIGASLDRSKFGNKAVRAYLRAGFEVVEIPITFADREAGGSKMSKAIVLEAIWKVPALRLAALAGRL